MTLESTLTGAGLYLGFLLALFLGARLLPGPRRQGQPLADGRRLEYKLTGLTLFALAHVAVLAGVLGFDVTPAILLDYFWEMLLAANLVSLLGGIALYAQGRRRGAQGRCRARYGALWSRYCEKARFRIVPWIY